MPVTKCILSWTEAKIVARQILSRIDDESLSFKWLQKVINKIYLAGNYSNCEKLEVCWINIGNPLSVCESNEN